jgi:hypothetical protein
VKLGRSPARFKAHSTPHLRCWPRRVGAGAIDRDPKLTKRVLAFPLEQNRSRRSDLINVGRCCMSRSGNLGTNVDKCGSQGRRLVTGQQVANAVDLPDGASQTPVIQTWLTVNAAHHSGLMEVNLGSC